MIITMDLPVYQVPNMHILCVRVCVRACVRVCVRACVCVRVCGQVSGWVDEGLPLSPFAAANCDTRYPLSSTLFSCSWAFWMTAGQGRATQGGEVIDGGKSTEKNDYRLAIMNAYSPSHHKKNLANRSDMYVSCMHGNGLFTSMHVSGLLFGVARSLSKASLACGCLHLSGCTMSDICQGRTACS